MYKIEKIIPALILMFIGTCSSFTVPSIANAKSCNTYDDFLDARADINFCDTNIEDIILKYTKGYSAFRQHKLQHEFYHVYTMAALSEIAKLRKDGPDDDYTICVSIITFSNKALFQILNQTGLDPLRRIMYANELLRMLYLCTKSHIDVLNFSHKNMVLDKDKKKQAIVFQKKYYDELIQKIDTIYEDLNLLNRAEVECFYILDDGFHNVAKIIFSKRFVECVRRNNKKDQN